MGASITRYIVVALAVFNYGFMLFDGMRAFVKGDYVRPKTGAYAGQLGPWSRLVQALGIQPLLGLMKTIFVVWGLAGLTITLLFLLHQPYTPYALMIIDVVTLWYLWAGTVSCALQLVLLGIMLC